MTLLSAVIVLFLIMDPIGNAPTFSAVLRDVPQDRRKAIIFRELLIALGILMLFLFFGSYLLKAMAISPPALSISGGVVLFLIAIRMIFPRPGGGGALDDGEDPFIVPLAMPLIAGPSTMAMVVLMATREPDRLIDWALALLIAWTLTVFILLMSEHVLRIVRARGQRALVRLMGMILTAMAVQMLLNGMAEFWAGLQS